jgi:hypothetical protein
MQVAMMVQTVVPMTAETLGAATKAARASGLSFERWLADAVELSYSVTDGLLDAPWDRASMELFAAVASESPGSLTGQWRTLFDLVDADQSLWRHVPCTVGDIEDGVAPCEPPHVNIDVLTPRWASLVARAFGEIGANPKAPL